MDTWRSVYCLDKEVSLCEQARRARDFFQVLNDAFLYVVGRKTAAVNNLLKHWPENEGRAKYEEAINPDLQIIAMIQSVYELFRQRLKTHSNSARMRVALFRNIGGYLEPVYSWDGAMPNCITSPKNDYKPKFNISSSAAECLAVYVAHSGDLLAVPDADEANSDPGHPYFHFGLRHQTQIKSIVAIPLHSQENNKIIDSVMVIDADYPGFFAIEDKTLYSELAKNVSQRLNYEIMIKEVLPRLR